MARWFRLTLLFAIALLPIASYAARKDSFGAIAYSYRTHRHGYSSGAATRVDAQIAALRECRSADCKVEVWFRNSCGALATGDDGAVAGWAHDASMAEAKKRALKACRARGRRCKLVAWTCSR